MHKIYVAGHFGGFNAGDEAMLGGFLSIIPGGQIVKVKYKNQVYINWGENVSVYQGSFISFIRQLKKDDILILCGGTHFHDDYTFLRLLRHWLYLSRINYMFLLAKRRGAIRFCIGNGFGPVNYSITKIITKQFAGLCNKITVRDAASSAVLKKLDARINLIHPDLANLLYLKYNNIIREKIKKNIVGISLTSLIAVGKKQISDEQLVTCLADALIKFAAKNHDASFRLFTIRAGEREGDYKITSALEQILKANHLTAGQYVFKNDLHELIENISECKVFIASRFHSAVLSSVARSKLIILSYHKKLTDFAGEILLPGNYIFNLQDDTILNRLPMIGKVLEELYVSNKLNYNLNEEKILCMKQQLQSLL